ncbi:sodium:calcium antiporter [Roseospira marina]|uniref:Sodium:calcium antiporter n=1 Tax=Roseospira marina TaxID=140057 RepID=A0A5M6ICN5_9PROT|nr:sodium:calcium antiporter [Roseospira marina]KAA5605986.1 sodium:calcium antiporter [Roseospira marina]MBB4313162.1 cation:H+ antiporter [Roseospira marina]MBB5086097.1 cation:H+ antiporter [Roseospira marina]
MIDTLSLPVTFGLFGGAGLLIALLGVRMADLADRLGDRTGLGEALIGGILLGLATSLSGVVVSVTAAVDGRPSLAFANAVGGIAAQTAFLAIADLLFRRANMEHAAAEIASVVQAAVLTFMLALPMLAATGPDFTLWGVHPVSVVLVVVYVLGMRTTARVREDPMWHPVTTRETRHDTPDESPDSGGGPWPLLAQFLVLALLLGVSGWVISKTGGRLADELGISETAIGALLTAVATSLPELITTLAAVRRGALQLAIGGIIGGNIFDVLFLSASDIAYRDGSLYHAVGGGDLFWVALGAAMTAVLLLGLVVRERRGIAGIGFESVAMLGLYGLAIGVQAVR